MHNDIEAQLQGPLDPRTRKRIVGNRDQVVFSCNLRNRCQIDELEQRIAWRLDPDHPRLRADRRAQSRRISHVDEGGGKAGGTLAHVFEQPVRAAVQIVARDDERTGVERVELRREESSVPTPPPKRLTDDMVRAERIAALRKRDPVLSAAIDALDLDVVD